MPHHGHCWKKGRKRETRGCLTTFYNRWAEKGKQFWCQTISKWPFGAAISLSWRKGHVGWCILPEHRSADRCRWDTGEAPAPELWRPPAIACSSRISGLVHFPHSRPGAGPLPSSQSGCRDDENWQGETWERTDFFPKKKEMKPTQGVSIRRYTEVPGPEIRGDWKSREDSLSFNASAFAGRRGNFFVTNLNFPFTFFLFFSLG